MLRVGHLIKGLGRGGAEMLLPHLVRESASAQDVHVGYFLPWKDAVVTPLEEAGASVTCFSARSSPQMFLRLEAVKRWIRECDLDLLHCHLPVSGAVGRLAARAAGVPVVYTEHNLQPRYRRPTRWLNRWTWTLQDRVVAVSDEVARSIADHLPAKVPVLVVPNGVPELPSLTGRRPATAFRRSLRLDRFPVVGTIAVFRSQKRLDLWVEVAGQVLRLVPEVRFVIVGDGPLRNDIERRARAIGLAERILFPGLQTNIVDWLGCMDVFLMTSEFEGLPLALLEAMMTGTPVVATAVGGIPEVITAGNDGYLTGFGAIEEQAARVAELLRDPEERARIGEAARDTVQSRFGIARMAAELNALYREVLAARSGQ